MKYELILSLMQSNNKIRKYVSVTNDIPENIKHAVIYCRKSRKTSNNELSFSGQQDACVEFCNINGLNILNIVHETVSAKNMELMTNLCDLIENITSNTLLVVSDVSRFSRNVMQGLKTIDSLLDKNCTIFSVLNNCCYNDNHFNRNQFRLFLNNAEFESDQIAERINRSLKHRRKVGSKIGRCKFGYSCHYIKGGIRKEKLNKHEQKIISMIKNMINNENKTPSEIANILNNKGLNFREKEWNSNRVRYVGKISN